MVDVLSPEDLEAVKAHIAALEAQHSLRPRTVEEWQAELHSMAEAFRGDSSDAEMAEIVAAMNLKSPPSEKGL